MSELATIWVLMLFVGIILFFIEMRQYAETARVQADKYCNEMGLQFISIHRDWWKLDWDKAKGPGIVSCYELAFSSNGENQIIGQVTLRNRRLLKIDTPPYPM